MTEDIRLSKVEILLQQNKYAEAEKVLKDLLAVTPNNIRLLFLLAEVHLQQEQYDTANNVIEHAIGLAPDAPHLFYAKSRIAWMQDHWQEAEKNILQAIALNPNHAGYFAFLSNMKLGRKQFSEALELANSALEIDAENLLALNTRSTALNKLNRKEEAFNTIEGALREDPNNAYTHSNYGWGLLEQGNHKKALEHFREALKNDPNFAHAQSGMLEALKAANPVYRLFLKYSFWMGNLTAKYQWGVIIGFYLAFRLLKNLSQSNPIATTLSDTPARCPGSNRLFHLDNRAYQQFIPPIQQIRPTAFGQKGENELQLCCGQFWPLCDRVNPLFGLSRYVFSDHCSIRFYHDAAPWRDVFAYQK